MTSKANRNAGSVNRLDAIFKESIDRQAFDKSTWGARFCTGEYKAYEAPTGVRQIDLLQAINFERNSSAWVLTPAGTLVEVPVGQPRIGYNPATGECEGLVVEQQETQIILYPADFANAWWTKDNLNTTVVDSPIKGENGLLIEADGANDEHRLQSSSPLSFPGSRHSVAFIFKPVGSGNYQLGRLSNNTTSIRSSFEVNSNGDVVRVGSNVTSTPVVRKFSDGTLYITATLYVEGGHLFGIQLLGVSGGYEYTGTDEAAEVYYIGASGPKGTEVDFVPPTSPILTSGQTATRLVDEPTIPIGDWWNNNGISFFVEIEVEQLVYISRIIGSNDTGVDDWGVLVSISSQRFELWKGGGLAGADRLILLFSSLGGEPSGKIRLAFSSDGNSFTHLSCNGASVSDEVPMNWAAILSDWNVVMLGQNTNPARVFNGAYNQLFVKNQADTAAQLDAWTGANQ